MLVSLFVVIARLTLTAWVGAASLFVMVSIAEIRHPGFNSFTRDQLVAIRFPIYYTVGFTLLGTGLLATATVLAWQRLDRPRFAIAATFSLVAFLLMLYDFFQIYTPLLEMVTPPGETKPASFTDLHQRSKWVNGVGVVCTMLASILLACPWRRSGAPAN